MYYVYDNLKCDMYYIYMLLHERNKKKLTKVIIYLFSA